MRIIHLAVVACLVGLAVQFAPPARGAGPVFPFETIHEYPLTEAGTVDAAADFNGDGNQDLLLVPRTGCATIRLGDGQGGFAAPAPVAPSIDPADVSVADMNGDGVPDIVATERGDTDLSVVVLLGDGAGGFDRSPDIALPGDYLGQVEVGDVDGDGSPDVITRAFHSPSAPGELSHGSIGTLLSDGTGGVGALIESPVGPPPGTYDLDGDWPSFYGTMAVGHFDGDHRADVAFAYTPSTLKSAGPIVVMRGGADGKFSEHVTSSVAPGLDTLSAADLNGDGFDDLVGNGWSSNTSSGDIVTLMNDTVGGFADPVSLPRQPSNFFAKPAVDDFDGDGNLDLVAAHQEWGGLYFWRGNGAGGFAEAQIDPESNTGDAVSGDFDNDGYSDVATAGTDGSDSAERLQIHRNVLGDQGPEAPGLSVAKVRTAGLEHGFLRRGGSVTGSCSIDCRVRLRLTLSRGAGRRLGLKNRNLFRGSEVWGTANTAMRFGVERKRARRLIRHSEGRLRARLSISASPLTGPAQGRQTETFKVKIAGAR